MEVNNKIRAASVELLVFWRFLRQNLNLTLLESYHKAEPYHLIWTYMMDTYN